MKSGPRSGVVRAAHDLGVARIIKRGRRTVEALMAEIASIVDEAAAALLAAQELTAAQTASAGAADALDTAGVAGVAMGASMGAPNAAGNEKAADDSVTQEQLKTQE